MILLLLAFWDLFAVMTPIGPLRWLVDLVHEKGTPLPGLLYQADIVEAHTNSSPDTAPKSSSDRCAKNPAKPTHTEAPGGLTKLNVASDCSVQAKAVGCRHLDGDICKDDEDDDDRTIKLGLGDFIFYSVLVARAATHGMAVFASCFLCILVVRTTLLQRCTLSRFTS